MKKRLLLLLCVASVFMLTSCASTYSVDRVSKDTIIDLSGNWNDTDINIVTSSLIDSCLSSAWINRYQMNNKGNIPTIIVGTIKNKSSEHIDTTIISKKIELALVKSGKAATVADFGNKDELRAEKLDQQYNSSVETAAELGEEFGADFILQGSVKTNIDSIGGKTVRTYYVDLELIDIQSSQKVWLDEDTVKKLIKQSKYSY
jgi:uncharacterized protein (TIGR02722 family)